MDWFCSVNSRTWYRGKPMEHATWCTLMIQIITSSIELTTSSKWTGWPFSPVIFLTTTIDLYKTHFGRYTLVINTSPDGRKTVRYLIFDFIAVNEDSDIKGKRLQLGWTWSIQKLLSHEKRWGPSFHFINSQFASIEKISGDWNVQNSCSVRNLKKIKTQRRWSRFPAIRLSFSLKDGVCWRPG